MQKRNALFDDRSKRITELEHKTSEALDTASGNGEALATVIQLPSSSNLLPCSGKANRGRPTQVEADSLAQLEEENKRLRNRVVELALEIQSLSEGRAKNRYNA